LGLRWVDVDWQSHTISLPAEADKCLQERRKPLHPIVLRHLVRIRGPWSEIFPWAHSERTFYRQWHAIQDAAAIPKRDHVKLHQLKATSMTHYATCESPWVAQRMGDHASIATGQHYVDVSRSLRGAVERFALPAAFTEEFLDADRPPPARHLG
jgi:integrase